MTTAPATHSVQGFRVTKTDDGKTIFHRVPIFAECERGDLAFGSKWMADAVAAAKQQERDGYLPPLHTRHHEPATDQTNAVRSVGVFRITDASPITFKGKRVAAIFADLIITDDCMADELSRMKYPYRSVEIFDPEGPPKINGLALLDHEAPYLELPMLLAGDVDDQRDPKRMAYENNGGAIPDTGVGVASATSFTLNYASDPSNLMLGSVRHGQRATLLFKFPDEETMPQAKPKQAAKAKKPANFADDKEGEKDTENMEGEEGGGMDIAAVCTAIESGAISVADMDSLLAAIQSQSAEAPVEEEEEAAAPAPAPGAEIMKGNSDQAKLFAAQQGKIDALEAKDAARDAADQRGTDVGEAMTRLAGKPLGANLEEKLTNFHKKADGNAELFKAYVDSMAQNAGDLPTDDSGANFAAQPKTPKSAMAFQALGGEAVDKAAQFAREYQTMSGMRASEESYVRINMKNIGLEVEETATA